jgi:hypothetical protein
MTEADPATPTLPPPAPSKPTRMSAIDLLFEDPSRATAGIERAVRDGHLLETMPDRAPKLSAAAARFMAGAVVDAIESVLTELGVGGMLIGGWTRLDEVNDARAATPLDHGSRHVTLFSHEITSEHEPQIDLMINKAPVPLLHLLFEAKFALKGCDLLIGDGELRNIVPGALGVVATLKSGSVPVLSHTIHELDVDRLSPDLATLVAVGPVSRT